MYNVTTTTTYEQQEREQQQQTAFCNLSLLPACHWLHRVPSWVIGFAWVECNNVIPFTFFIVVVVIKVEPGEWQM